jgi:hypothetical protein
MAAFILPAHPSAMRMSHPSASTALTLISFPQIPVKTPQDSAQMTVAHHCAAGFQSRLAVCSRIRADENVNVSAKMWYVGLMMQGEPPVKTAAMTPAAKGNANPAISLSTLISFLFFAKVVIIFLTLHGYI